VTAAAAGAAVGVAAAASVARRAAEEPAGPSTGSKALPGVPQTLQEMLPLHLLCCVNF
jgi:hypothetical protein